MMVRFARAGAKRFARKPYLEDATPWSEMLTIKSISGIEDPESDNAKLDGDSLSEQSTNSSSEDDEHKTHDSSKSNSFELDDDHSNEQSTSSLSEDNEHETRHSSKSINVELDDKFSLDEPSNNSSEENEHEIQNSSGFWMVRNKNNSKIVGTAPCIEEGGIVESETSHSKDEISDIEAFSKQKDESFQIKQSQPSQKNKSKASYQKQEKCFRENQDVKPRSSKSKDFHGELAKASQDKYEAFHNTQDKKYHRKQFQESDHKTNKWKNEHKVKYGRHRLIKSAAERIDAMKEKLMKDGIAEDDVKDAVQLTARREEKKDRHRRQKENGMVCFACQKPGHRFADCPNKNESQKGALCYTCRSSEHISRNCPKNANNENKQVFPNAVCFRCNQTGHIARQCSTSKLTCMGCGEVGHIKRHCPSSSGYKPNQMKRGLDDKQQRSGRNNRYGDDNRQYENRNSSHGDGNRNFESHKPAKKPKYITFKD